MLKLINAFLESAKANGYNPVKVLPSGEIAGISRLAFTWGLYVGLGTFYRTRFCYPTLHDAVTALDTWDGKGDPPGPWIKEKGYNKEFDKIVDRSNPHEQKTPS